MEYNIENINFETLVVSLLYYGYVDRTTYKLRKDMFQEDINQKYIKHILKHASENLEDLNQSFIAVEKIFIYNPTQIDDILKIFKIKTVFEIFYKKAIQILWNKANEENKGPSVDNLKYVNKTIEEFREILASLERTEDNRTPFEKYKEKIIQLKSDILEGVVKEGFFGLSTGIGTYDEILKGLKPASYNLLAGRPSMGKTSLALDIAVQSIKEGKNVVIFSLEMPAVDLVGRLIPKIDKNLTINQTMNGEDLTNDIILKKIMDASEYIEKSGLEIIDFSDKANISPVELEAECNRIQLEKGNIDLVILDYIQLLSNASSANRDENSMITAYSGALQRLTKKTNAAWIILSQLNRELEKRNNKRPMLSDLRGSGSLEQDADTITFVYRDAVYQELEIRERLAKNPGDKVLKEQLENLTKTKQNSAEIIIGKNRNGPTGTTYDVWFYKPTATYSTSGNLVEDISDLVDAF